MSENNKNNTNNEDEIIENQKIEEDMPDIQKEIDEKKSDIVSDENKKENSDKKDNKKSDKQNQPKKTKRFSTRAFKRGGLAIALTAIIIVFAVLLNVLVDKLSSRFPILSYDFTATGAYELSQNSIDLLTHIDKDIQITVLLEEEEFISCDNDGYFRQANEIMKQYTQYCDKIKLKYVDIVSNPAIANNYPDDELAQTDVIVSCGDKYKILTVEDLFNINVDYYTYSSYITSSKAEETITSALLNVVSDESVKVSVVTDFSTKSYYEYFINLLKKNNYDVEEISLLTDDIDAETGIVVLLPPSKDYGSSAIEKLSEFLVNSGEYGKTVVYVPNITTVETPNLDDFCEEWGVKVGDGLAFEGDTTRLIGSTYMDLVLAEYDDESYTADLKYPDVPVISVYSRPIEIVDSSITTTLLKYSDKSGIQPSTADENWSMKDAMLGNETPVATLSTKSSSSNSSNLLVIGSAESLSETILSSPYNNSDYYLKLLYKLSGRDDIAVSIEAKSLSGSEMTVTTSQANAYGIFFMILLPVIIIVTGIIIWARRRNR